MGSLEIELLASNDFGPCECCGDRSRTVSGLVTGVEQAAYFVHWTLGKVPEHGAHIDLIMGKWGDGTRSADRYAVSLEYRRTEEERGFMVIDSEGRKVASDPLVGRGLSRTEVLKSDVAARAFQIVDAVWLADPRIAEVRGDAA